MPVARYHIQIDWDDDGDFLTPEESLNRDVIAAEWQLGLANGRDHIAAPSWAALTLRNRARRYTPDNAAGPLYGSLVPRKKARITSEFGGTTRTHFTGWTDAITPGRDGTVIIRCSGVEALLQRAEVFPPLGINQTADEVIGAVLAQVDYPPAIAGYWRLGMARLGVDTRLPDMTVYTTMDRGATTFPYVGDNWPDGLSAWAILRDVAETERGVCFVDRTGRVIFWNRHHLLTDSAEALTITANGSTFAVSHDSAAIVNRAVVTCHPREVGGGSTVLWTLREPLRLPPGEAREIRVRLADDAGLRSGALTLATPAPGADYRANTDPDGLGSDHTSAVGVTVSASASTAALTFHNTAGMPLYVQAGATLSGVPLSDSGAIDATFEDRTSILYYGRRAQGLDLPLLADPAAAWRLARHIVSERKDPRGRIRSITLNGETNATMLEAILHQTIGYSVQLVDDLTAHDGRYHIVGERHTLQRGGTSHSATWILRPAAPFTHWLLGISGRSELGQTTRAAY